MDAGPVLLEPIVTMIVTVLDKYTVDVMGELNKRRGRVLGMNPVTGESGEVSYEFARYAYVQAKEETARVAEAAE